MIIGSSYGIVSWFYIFGQLLLFFSCKRSCLHLDACIFLIICYCHRLTGHGTFGKCNASSVQFCLVFNVFILKIASFCYPTLKKIVEILFHWFFYSRSRSEKVFLLLRCQIAFFNDSIRCIVLEKLTKTSVYFNFHRLR